MYPYHNMNIKRIKSGEFLGVSESEDIKFAFLLVFKTHPQTRPIRWKSIEKYRHILKGLLGDEQYKNLYQD